MLEYTIDLRSKWHGWFYWEKANFYVRMLHFDKKETKQIKKCMGFKQNFLSLLRKKSNIGAHFFVLKSYNFVLKIIND